MGMYADALGKYVDDLAQQPGGSPWMKKFRNELPDKVRFTMLDHKSLHIAPPFPLMSVSALGMTVDTLKDISLAIYEVSCLIHLYPVTAPVHSLVICHLPHLKHIRPAAIFPRQPTGQYRSTHDKQVDHLQPVCAIDAQVESIRLASVMYKQVEYF